MSKLMLISLIDQGVKVVLVRVSYLLLPVECVIY